MKVHLKLLFISALTLVQFQTILAQETPSIKVRKSSNLAKVVLDNTNYKLVVFDRFGNPTESRILHYKLYVKLKTKTKLFEGYLNKFDK